MKNEEKNVNMSKIVNLTDIIPFQLRGSTSSI